jgi:hypothetical protein
MNAIYLFDNTKQKVISLDYDRHDSTILMKLYLDEYKVPTDKELKEVKSKHTSQEIKKKISELEDFIPLYDIFSDNIYLINKENVYARVVYDSYRFPTVDLLKKLKKNKKVIQFMNNFDLSILENTYIRVFYFHSREVGKDLISCRRPSFLPIFKHIDPYYNRTELINLALNMELIKPDKTYYTPDKIKELCKLVKKNDISAVTLLQHKEHIFKHHAIHLIQHYTLNGSYFFNKYLRNVGGSEIKNQLLEENITPVWKLILSAPAFDKSYTVYRFVDSDYFLEHLKVGDIFIDHGFTSTTRNPFYRSDHYQFGFILIKIKLPANKKGVALSVESYSHFPKEEEIILPPFTSLKLISRGDETEFYHIDDLFRSRVVKKYEFEYVKQMTHIEFPKNYLSFDESHVEPLDLLKLTFHNDDLKKRIVEFQQRYVNSLSQISTKIGNKVYTMIVEWYDSTSAYKNFYAVSNKNGFSIYAFEKGTILFFLEIVEPLHEIHVNYYFRHSESLLLYELIKESDFLDFVSKISYVFRIQKVIIYSHYKFCQGYRNDRNDDDNNKKNKLITSSSNFRVDFYDYLKSSKQRFFNIENIKSKFDYSQLDKLKEIDVDTILNVNDRDEIYQVYGSLNKKTNVADFYLYIIDEHCHLTDLMEKKISRLFGGLMVNFNPFLFDYYVLDSFVYLYNKNMIDILPPVDNSIIDIPVTKEMISTTWRTEMRQRETMP